MKRTSEPPQPVKEPAPNPERLASLFGDAADAIAVPVSEMIAQKAPSGDSAEASANGAGRNVVPVKDSVKDVLGSGRMPPEGPKDTEMNPFFSPSTVRDTGTEETRVAERIKQSVGQIPLPRERQPVKIAKALPQESVSTARREGDTSRTDVARALRQVRKPGHVPERQRVQPLPSVKPSQESPVAKPRLQDELQQEVRGVKLPPEVPVRAPVNQVPAQPRQVQASRSEKRLAEELEQEVRRVRRPGAVPVARATSTTSPPRLIWDHPAS